jgi:prolyl-tRNA synthetase
MLDIYAEMAINECAIPVIKGRKSDQEKFAGAAESYTIEGMMGNTWALQSGTSHFLGQNFARVFEIQFLDEENELQFAWTTSWGVSTRMVGGVIMAHGDDKGLRLPPHIAPIQVVITPIWKTPEDQDRVLVQAQTVHQRLDEAGFRVHLDRREGLSPGFKFNDWEMRGVPVRLEIGPRDVEAQAVVAARRDVPGKEGKHTLPIEGLEMAMAELLENIQSSMLDAATQFRDAHLHEASTYEELKSVVGNGWALIWHCGTPECEDRIKEETKATSRCFPLDSNPEWSPDGRTCTVCGKPAFGRAYFSRAY